MPARSTQSAKKVLHSPPITIKPRAVFSGHQSHDHDLLLSAASDLGCDVGPLMAATLLSAWDLTHATPVPTPLALPLARPPRLFNLTFWGENPGAGAFYIWLLPILLPELRHIRFVVSLTHCFKGGTGWRKYTSILTNDDTLASRVGPCGSCPHTNCGHSKRHEVIIGGNVRLPPDALNMKHSVPPALYDAELYHLLLEIPPDQRHHYAIVHMGSGSQSSMHISCHGFVVLTVDKEPTTNTKFRSVSPTLNIDYDSRPIMGIVALVAAKAGFHVGAVVGILFDPCCITRTTMTRMNHNHRYSDGQPFSAPAYTRDVFDTAHILHFDYAVGQRLARTARASDSDSDSDSDSSERESRDSAASGDDGHTSAAGTAPIAPTAGSGNSAGDDHSSDDGDRGDDDARGGDGGSGDDGDGGDGSNDDDDDDDDDSDDR